MKREEIQVGGIYTAKVSNRIVNVRVERITKREGSDYRRGGTYYVCTNLNTNREIVIKSAAKFRKIANKLEKIEE